ncbi:hypothetical protein [Ekhidna sp.]|uniref:hypothetical protein n=1 Tax=Ekhidna sp. TaxID=2608089 RepID=UPI0032972D73
MKKHIAFLSLLLLGTLAMGQDFEAPKKGAKIYAKEYTITLDEGDDKTFELWIVRSRLAKRTKFSAPKLLSSSGLTFDVTTDIENADHFTVKVNAESVVPGAYTVTVSSRSNSSHQVTGTTLSFNVMAAKAVASEDGE